MARTPVSIPEGTQHYKWTVLKKSNRKDTYMKNPYICKCFCGEVRLIDANRLVNGHSKSCRQCSNKDIAKIAKGQANLLAKKARNKRPILIII